MSWSQHHSQSATFAGLAEVAIQQRSTDEALRYYALAAQQEEQALAALDPALKLRTWSITIVSAASLWYKARSFAQAQQIAYHGLANTSLMLFAREQLRDLLQTIWSEETRAAANVAFTAGEVLVAVSGGDIVTGGAPLDLIHRKVDEIGKLFFRTIEMMLDMPFRQHGGPAPEIQAQFRPWLFQAPAGSYQFVVRVQKPPQLPLPFMPHANLEVDQITTRFMTILRATDDPTGALPQVVPDPKYRDGFLKLTRNLSPTGRVFEQIQLSTPGLTESPPVILSPDTREAVNQAIRETDAARRRHDEATGTTVQLHGILRAVQLNDDWLEINLLNDPPRIIKIRNAGDAIDDVVGPMVNHIVIVEAVKTGNTYAFRDIQAEE